MPKFQVQTKRKFCISLIIVLVGYSSFLTGSENSGTLEELTVSSGYLSFAPHLSNSLLNCLRIIRATESTGGGHTTWRIFSYKELHTATNGFSDDNLLGEGGFGSVYWGKTSDGLQVHIPQFSFLE